MPQVYRRSAPSPRNSSESRHFPQPTNADDSIVLSDLVRTGEASRLRRRGAMRLDHTAARSSYNPPAQPLAAGPTTVTSPPPPVTRPVFMPPRTTTPPWVTPDIGGDDDYGYGGSEWRGWMADDPTAEASGSGVAPDEGGKEEEMDTEEGFILVCGGEVKDHHGYLGKDRRRPFEPSPLPISPCSASSSRRCPRTRPVRRTNGCGAVIHLRSFPQKQNGVWMGKEEATDVVTSMDSAYFERSIVAKMMKSACGCIREGIGCSSCGNTLGTRYMPCQAASEGIFSNPSSSSYSVPMHPSGPGYWRGRYHPHGNHYSSSSKSLFSYIYTFFGDHVTSIPAYEFRRNQREHCEHTVGLASPQSGAPARPSSTWYGYPTSTSPRPMSPFYGSSLQLPDPPSRTGLPMLNIPPPNGGNGPRPERVDESGAELDADGVVIEEPSSPDKIGNDTPWAGLR